MKSAFWIIREEVSLAAFRRLKGQCPQDRAFPLTVLLTHCFHFSWFTEIHPFFQKSLCVVLLCTMTQAMKCRYLEGICDLPDTGHEENGQNFPSYYARKMFNDDTQQAPRATQLGLSERLCSPKDFYNLSVILPHSRIFQERGYSPHCRESIFFKKECSFQNIPSTEHCGSKDSKHHS